MRAKCERAADSMRDPLLQNRVESHGVDLISFSDFHVHGHAHSIHICTHIRTHRHKIFRMKFVNYPDVLL